MTMHPAVTNGSYDIARIRADFPALALQVYGKPLVYLDNAASAQKPKAVLDRRSIWSPTRSRASASSRATRSCSRSWSTIPTSCRGISCASGRAR